LFNIAGTPCLGRQKKVAAIRSRPIPQEVYCFYWRLASDYLFFFLMMITATTITAITATATKMAIFMMAGSLHIFVARIRSRVGTGCARGLMPDMRVCWYRIRSHCRRVICPDFFDIAERGKSTPSLFDDDGGNDDDRNNDNRNDNGNFHGVKLPSMFRTMDHPCAKFTQIMFASCLRNVWEMLMAFARE